MKVGDLVKYTNRYQQEMIALILAIDGKDILCFIGGKKMWLSREFLSLPGALLIK